MQSFYPSASSVLWFVFCLVIVAVNVSVEGDALDQLFSVVCGVCHSFIHFFRQSSTDDDPARLSICSLMSFLVFLFVCKSVALLLLL